MVKSHYTPYYDDLKAAELVNLQEKNIRAIDNLSSRTDLHGADAIQLISDGWTTQLFTCTRETPGPDKKNVLVVNIDLLQNK